MGLYREFNPKMVSEWHGVVFRHRDSDRQWETTPWGRQVQTWAGYNARRAEAVEWCDGPMIHGRFSYSENFASQFFFKSKRDAMAFKLTFGGE